MALGIDAQVLAAMAPLLEALGETEKRQSCDDASRRINGHRMFDYVASTWEPVPASSVDRHTLTAADGATLDLAWYHTTGRTDRQRGAVPARRRHDLRP